MEFRAHQSFPVADRSYLNSIKRDIKKLVEGYGFSEAKRGKIDIIVSELASNLVKHTIEGGEILIKPTGIKKITGIEIISLDNGPGMTEPQRMMEDGVSTIGSQGEGLGAIKRLSDEFDLYTKPGNGTVILSRLGMNEVRKKTKIASEPYQIQAIMVAKAGETACGDNWAYVYTNGQYTIMAADGLGHGENAHEASAEAVVTFRQQLSSDPTYTLKQIHQEIKKTRGAVGAISLIDIASNSLTFCGVGNIMGKVYSSEGIKTLLSYNGILGHNIPNTINNHVFSWNSTSLLVMHSDGLKSRWDLDKYPRLRKHDASIIAALLYKNYTRKSDDVLVIVGKKLI